MMSYFGKDHTLGIFFSHAFAGKWKQICYTAFFLTNLFFLYVPLYMP